MAANSQLLSEPEILQRIFNHIDNKTTDLGDSVWKQPVESYWSEERFEAEIALLRRLPIVFCLSAMLLDKGSYIARKAAGTPLLVVRGEDGKVRAFINACRHRGMQVATDKGCAKSFVCPYHAWTYGLEGELRHIPGQAGFPGVEREGNGLVEVSALEKVVLSTSIKVNPSTQPRLKTYQIFFRTNKSFLIKANTLMTRIGSYSPKRRWRVTILSLFTRRASTPSDSTIRR